MESNKEEEIKGRKYVVGGKEWIVEKPKISMWSKAKCNKDKKKHVNKNKDKETSSSLKKHGIIRKHQVPLKSMGS